MFEGLDKSFAQVGWRAADDLSLAKDPPFEKRRMRVSCDPHGQEADHSPAGKPKTKRTSLVTGVILLYSRKCTSCHMWNTMV